MAEPLAVSPFLSGDPVSLGPDVTSLGRLLACLGLAAEDRAGLLGIAPGVALVHSLTGAAGQMTLRCARLPLAPPLDAAHGPVDVVLVLAAPIIESGRALRLVARLAACFRDPAVHAAARSATTRAELVEALAGVEGRVGEEPLDGGDVLALLGSGPGGLATAEAERRRLACGGNRLERMQRRPIVARFVEQFSSFFAILLWIGGGIALLAGAPELAWAIFAVIAINGLFSFFQEYRAERAVEALERLLPHEVTVHRDGRLGRVPADALVPGDVVDLEEGDQIPADGQLLAAADLRVDQSALTGESHAVFKLVRTNSQGGTVPLHERRELLFGGAGVVAGTGTFVVCATGMRTQIGGIAGLTQAVGEAPSPLQREMSAVTRIVTILAVSFGGGFFALGLLTGSLPPHDGFVFSLGVIIANVPEGLLPTLTLALALGVQRMAREGSLVKRLSAVESLGAATVICTDKTGTLTQNRMTARFVWVAGQTLDASSLDTDAPADARELFEAVTLASQATAEHGDPTEVALVAAAARIGVEPEKIRGAHEVLAPHPFDSYRKRMTLVRAAEPGAIAFVKGAPREMLALSTTIRWQGRTDALTESLRRTMIDAHDRLAADGLRILAVAVRPLAEALIHAGASAVERELIFLGMIALWDPPRPEVSDAIALCRRAGIRVLMVTGDYGLTAQAIGRQIGLQVDKVITGGELDRLTAQALRPLVAEPGVVFTRTSPAHKLAIVSALRAAGEIVAVTGDGVNDAPALKAADIGVAMGKRGSEVAKESAVMVITDDNFASIVTAVRQGRAIYANIGKFVTYIFTHNFAELVAFLAFVFLRIPLPLTVMQVLAIDLGTDLLPALALGAEPPEPGVMDRPPRDRSKRLLGPRRLLHAYGFLGSAEAVFALGAFFWTYWLAGWRPGLPMAGQGELYHRATTMTLSAIVASQVGNVLACRTDRESVFRAGLFSNPLVFAGIGAEIVLLLVLILVPPFPQVFGLAPLAFPEWGVLALLPPAMLLLEEGRKWAVRLAGPSGRNA